MFESVQHDDTPARLRAAALPPFAALLVALAYLTAYPLLARVPPLLFWLVVLVLLAGATGGIVRIVRVARRARVRGPAIGWLVAAAVVELVCLRMVAGLLLPWL